MANDDDTGEAEGASNDLDKEDEIEDDGEVEEEEEDEEVDVEDGEYTLRFEGEVNPLDFIEDDAHGVQPYQQFERLEYEALAEKKRKAISEGDGLAKKARQEDAYIVNIEEIMEGLNFGGRRKSRKLKKRGRRKGSKNKLSPIATRKLGEANLYYAKRQYEEAIRILKEVIMLAPNLSETYHTLGLIYEETGDKKKAINFYMLAAHLAPKEHASLWKSLVALSIDQGNTGQATYCLSKAIKADPEDTSLRWHRASLYTELGDYQKAAEAYHQIVGIYPENVEARKMAAKMYRRCDQLENAIGILEEYFNGHSTIADFSIVSLLIAIHMESGAYAKALHHIGQARSVQCPGEQFPLHLNVKAGICQVHLGNIEEAEVLFKKMSMEHAEDFADLVMGVADTFMNLGHYESALKYYFIPRGNSRHYKELPHLKIAQCYLFLKKRTQAIEFFYKGGALQVMGDNIDARLTLASLLLEEDKEDDAIILLSPPIDSGGSTDTCLEQSKPWWINGKVKMQLAQIYFGKKMFEEFVDAIFPCIRETLFFESLSLKKRKRLTKSDLFERVKVLDSNQDDSIFRGFRPLVAPSDLLKATRAKKKLQRKAAVREEKKAAALAAGMSWQSDDSDEDSQRPAPKEPPLPNLLKDSEHFQLILNLCKALASLQRYWEALEVVNHILRLGYNSLSVEKKMELQSIGAQLAYNTTDPKHAYDCVRHIVQQHPYSYAAWNCYYKVISRLENKLSKHSKFLNNMRTTCTDCIPPFLIFGHQLTMISQHQAAAREYLEAYKLQSDSPLINLCVGTALINLALGHRLQNKHHCLAQGFAFLYSNLNLCENNQEAFYNIGRACHHVGIVNLAVSYYEKALSPQVKDYPIPKLLNEDSSRPENLNPGYCDLRREAAYNLHLIYKKSGAVDLARQVLKDHCTL
ncbi:hypothetical protein Sjap_021267 [Stephania japonica]|uniref:General transcription factor 3C polypeptide 3 n=1 Tax=Stephania japonica TaxID=461633 RepID=A0AAP0ELM7_9MAGN